MRVGNGDNTDPLTAYYSHTELANRRVNAVFSAQLYWSPQAGDAGVCRDALPQSRRVARRSYRTRPVSPRPAPALGARLERGARRQPEHRATGLPHARRQRHGLAPAKVWLFCQRTPPPPCPARRQPPSPAPGRHIPVGTGAGTGPQYPAPGCDAARARHARRQ
ncbi:hypothetical protein D3C81_1401540 [compost metagenome]